MFGKKKKIEHMDLLKRDDVTPGLVVEIATLLDQEKKELNKRSNEFHDGNLATLFWIDTLNLAIQNNVGVDSLDLASRALERYREIKRSVPTGHEWSDGLVDSINDLEGVSDD